MSDLPYPYLDPSQGGAWLDVQRKQQLAQALMGAFQQSNQTPADWNSMKVVPRRGALGTAATLATALLAGKSQNEANTSQMNYMQGLFGGQGASPTTPSATPSAPPTLAPPPTDPNEQTVQPLIARNGQSFSQAVGGGPTPNSPMIPQGMSRGMANSLVAMMGPEKYATSFVAPQFQPTDMEKTIKAAGIDPASPMGQSILRMSLAKQTTNLENVRPGGTLYDATSGKPTFTAPNNGVATAWGPNGPSQSVIPGAPAAQAQMTGAETAGKVVNTPQEFPTQGGGTRPAYPSDVLGAPPALRGQTAPGATPITAPKVAAPSIGSTQPSKPAPAKPGDPWSNIPKLNISSGLGSPDTYTKARYETAAAKDAELASQYGKEADLADQKLQYNAEARKTLSNAETGPLSEWMTENRAKLLEWGIPESIIPGSGSVTPTMELNKNLKQAALQGARATFGSRMTQMEVRLQHEELSPSTAMTKEAIASLQQQDDIKQLYAKQRAEDYGKYTQQGGDPRRFESWYAKEFPLSKFAQHMARTPTMEEIQAEAQRRGLLK